MMFKPMTSRLYAIRKLSVLTMISLLGLFLWSSEGYCRWFRSRG